MCEHCEHCEGLGEVFPYARVIEIKPPEGVHSVHRGSRPAESAHCPRCEDEGCPWCRGDLFGDGDTPG